MRDRVTHGQRQTSWRPIALMADPHHPFSQAQAKEDFRGAG